MAITVETLEVAVKQTGSEKASSGMKNLAVAAGAAFAAYKILSKAISASVDAWAVQEKALIKVRAGLKAQGIESDATVRKLERFTSALQDQTNVGDETTLALIGQALAMGATADESEKATQAALGLSEAMGIGLDAALRGVVNAQNGNYESLQRYIPELKNVTTDTEAWDAINRSAEAGLLSLGAQTDTFTGQITKVKNNFGDFMEQVGRSITGNGILKKFADDIAYTTAQMQLQNDAMDAWHNLSADLQASYRSSSEFVTQYNNNISRTDYWTERLAASTKDLGDVFDSVWTAEKRQEALRVVTKDIELYQQSLEDVLATPIEQFELQRARALAQVNTEYADYDENLKTAINNLYDAKIAQELLIEAEKDSALQQRENDRLARDADAAAKASSALRIQAIRAEQAAYAGLASALTSFLGTAFGDSKAAASVMAAINTALAVTNVLANIIPPFNFIAAGLVAAAGAAQIATINGASFANGTPAGGYVVPPGYEDDSYPVSAKSGETVNISRMGEGGGSDTQIVIMLDSSVIAKVTTDLIANRRITIRQSDLVAS